MSPPTFWLIGQPTASLPEPLFLHVFDDGEAEAEMDWQADRTRALRFVSSEAAGRFAALHRISPFVLSEHPSADLVRTSLHDFDRGVAVA